MHGNYLSGSIVAAGLDPADLPTSDPSAMSFGSDGGAKAWRDVWGSGQGIGVVEAVVPAAELVARLTREYLEAKAALDAAVITPAAVDTTRGAAPGVVRRPRRVRVRSVRPVRPAGWDQWCLGAFLARSKEALISASASASPTQLAPSTLLPGSRSL